jgi:hypothetical protein
LSKAYCLEVRSCQRQQQSQEHLQSLPQALQNYNQAIALALVGSLSYNNHAAMYYPMKQDDQAWANLRSCEALGGTPLAGLMLAIIQATNPTEA